MEFSDDFKISWNTEFSILMEWKRAKTKKQQFEI